MTQHIEDSLISSDSGITLGDAIDTLDKDQRAQMSDPEVCVDNQGRVKYSSSEGEITNYGKFHGFEDAAIAKLRLNELED